MRRRLSFRRQSTSRRATRNGDARDTSVPEKGGGDVRSVAATSRFAENFRKDGGRLCGKGTP